MSSHAVMRTWQSGPPSTGSNAAAKTRWVEPFLSTVRTQACLEAGPVHPPPVMAAAVPAVVARAAPAITVVVNATVTARLSTRGVIVFTLLLDLGRERAEHRQVKEGVATGI
ncbi:hypothetical protein DT019_16680 [Streptomyces sp. SDr-06]|nr:hypothetical protein DT019_16680 [Streptomyces sp. SDr-06]